MTNEELTTPGISSSVSHGKRAGEMFVGIDLALNRVAWSSSPIPIGAACLNDEVGDDTMKGKSIIESWLGEFHKIRHSVGGIFVIEVNGDVPPRGFNDGFGHDLLTFSEAYSCLIKGGRR